MSLDVLVPFELSVGSPIDTRKRKIPCRRELLIKSLQQFYTSRTEIGILLPILRGEGEMSLRLIDWFVTTYAKKHNVSYMLDGQEFLVYLNYKSQLKAFSKKLFDPFCRRERIQYQCLDHEPFFTTVGQLNFFRWAFEKNILQYMQTNLDVISKEEKANRTSSTNSTQSSLVTVSSTPSTSSVKSRQRRTEKGPSSVKLMHKHELEIKLSFD